MRQGIERKKKMSNKWIIVERKTEEYHEDGIRFKAFPCIGNDIKKTIEIATYGEKETKCWIVKECDKKGGGR